MSHYKPYPAYKDSGVEWLGDVPTHWSVKPLKWVGTYQNSNVDKKTYEGQAQVRLCNYTDVYKNEFIIDSMDFMMATASGAEIASMAVKKGDIIITKDSEGPTDIGIPALVVENLDNVVCGYHLTVIRVPESYQRFVFRLIQSDPTKARFYVESPGITRYGLNQDAIGGLPLVLPPPREAEKLASYMDSETVRIDALVEKKTRFIELLREKRQALITHAVTKGLDPNVKMKDSGVEWLGEVPEHWEVEKGSRIGTLFGSGPVSEDEVFEEGSVPFIKVGSLSAEGFEIAKWNWYVNESTARRTSQNSDFIVFPKRGAAIFLNKVNIVKCPALIDPNLMGWKIRRTTSSEYVAYLLTVRKLEELADVSTVPQINNKHIEPEKFPMPPLCEQHDIVKFLAAECRKLASLKAKTERSIELLKERRSALITAAVTGQIDLREAA